MSVSQATKCVRVHGGGHIGRSLRCRRPQRAALLPHRPATGGDGGNTGMSARNGEPDGPPVKQMPYRAIAALAAVGFADTAYLTANKLLNLTPACPLNFSGGAGGGCGDILTSEWSMLFGRVPLALVGMLAYGGMAALAWAGWRSSSLSGAGAAAVRTTSVQRQQQASFAMTSGSFDAEEAPAGGASAPSTSASQPSPAPQEADLLRTGVFAGGLALTATSAFLVYVMLTQFDGALCPWCLLSAASSFSIAALAASGLRRSELLEAVVPGAGVITATLLFLTLALGNPTAGLAAGGYDLDYRLPQVTTESSPAAVSLAQRLRDSGAKMYGAFWCSHCYDQKQAFGAEAMDAFPYVECYPEGLHKDTKMADACINAPGGLQGFPTWVVGGQQLVGQQSFEQLEAALAKAQPAASALAAGAGS